MTNSIEKIIAEYSEDYCHFLEAAYGPGMMSEGGAAAIDQMFTEVDIHNKSLLDIGFGLGGAALYLAEHYQAQVTGIEINPWMVQEAQKRTPAQLKRQVDFKLYHPNSALPLQDEQFDVVFSKGVLTHLEDKTNLFAEVYRVLKPGGQLIIDDWLSPMQNQWGQQLQQMCEVEGLTLHAETLDNYIAQLQAARFTDIQSRNESKHYHGYNLAIIDHLKAMSADDPAFTDFTREEAAASYQLIANSIQQEELLIYWLSARKPT